MALSRLGITAIQFYQLTPIEFDYALNDHHDYTVQKTKFYQQTSYEVARYMLTHQWNMSGRTLKQPIKDSKKALPLPWDLDEPKKYTSEAKQTPEQMAGILKSIARHFNTKK